MKITMAHGSGGIETTKLIQEVFKKHLHNEILDQMEDAAVLQLEHGKIAFSTDSFVVHPLFFQGGDIGKLAVCGTVNDLLMMGATPKYLTLSMILEEGLELELLEKVVKSIAVEAKNANVKIVAGDTKVVEGHGGLYINTAGIGLLDPKRSIHISNARKGDQIILSGALGNHHACILSHRLGIENNIQSDCQTLNNMVQALLSSDVNIKTMRDVTRGGLSTVLNELAESSSVQINIQESLVKIDTDVQAFCDIMGLDPLYMGNEGKFILVVPQEDSQKAVEILQKCKGGHDACVIGKVVEYKEAVVTLTTALGGTRILDSLQGEGLPRIC